MKNLEILRKENFNKLIVIVILMFTIIVGLILFLRDGDGVASPRTFRNIYNDMQIQNIESYNSNFRFIVGPDMITGNISNYNDEQIVIRSYSSLDDDFIGVGIVYDDGKFYRERISENDFEPGLYSEIDFDFNYLNPLKLLSGLNYVNQVEEVIGHTLGDEFEVYEVTFDKDGIQEMLDYFGHDDITVTNGINGKIHVKDGMVDTIIYEDEDLNIRATFHSFGTVRRTDIN